MRNHLYTNIGSLLILGSFIYFANTSFPAGCYDRPLTSGQCKEGSPVATQYHVTFRVTDKASNAPIPNLTMRFTVTYYNATIDSGTDKCTQAIVSSEDVFGTTNSSGEYTLTTNPYTMDNEKDEVLIFARTFNTDYAANQRTIARYIESDFFLTVDFELLKNSAL